MYPALSRSHTVVVIHICRAHNKFHVFYSINIILRVFKVRSVEAKLFNLKSSICSGYVSPPLSEDQYHCLVRIPRRSYPCSCSQIILVILYSFHCARQKFHTHRSVTAVRLFKNGVLKIHNCHVFHPFLRQWLFSYIFQRHNP